MDPLPLAALFIALGAVGVVTIWQLLAIGRDQAARATADPTDNADAIQARLATLERKVAELTAR